MKITKFDVLLNVWVSLILNIFLNTIVPIANGTGLTLSSFASSYVLGVIIGFILITFLPIAPLGNKFGDLFKLDRGDIKHQLVSNVLVALIMATIMSSFMTWWGIKDVPGYQDFYVASVVSSYPLSLFLTWLSQNIALCTGIPLVKKALGIPPHA